MQWFENSIKQTEMNEKHVNPMQLQLKLTAIIWYRIGCAFNDHRTNDKSNIYNLVSLKFTGNLSACNKLMFLSYNTYGDLSATCKCAFSEEKPRRVKSGAKVANMCSSLSSAYTCLWNHVHYNMSANMHLYIMSVIYVWKHVFDTWYIAITKTCL